MVAISDGATETTETFKRYFQRKVEVRYGKKCDWKSVLYELDMAVSQSNAEENMKMEGSEVKVCLKKQNKKVSSN